MINTDIYIYYYIVRESRNIIRLYLRVLKLNIFPRICFEKKKKKKFVFQSKKNTRGVFRMFDIKYNFMIKLISTFP